METSRPKNNNSYRVESVFHAPPGEAKSRGIRATGRTDSMQESQSKVFRAKALHEYVKRSEQSVLPKLISPRTFTFVWILFAIMVAGGMAAWLTQVPVYVTGMVVVVKGDGAHGAVEDQVAMLLLLPPETLSRLKTGQKVTFGRGGANTRLSSSIVTVEPDVLSPQAVQDRFALAGGATSQIRGPVAAAFVRWQQPAAGLTPLAHIGSFYEASVEVGSRPVISLLPVFGRFFSGATTP